MVSPVATRMPSRRARRFGAVALVVAAACGLAGCAGDSEGLSAQYKQGSDKGYVEGDSSTASFAPGQRADAVPFEGVTEFGDEFSSDELIGSVSVVNFWYAGCAPCRAEAKDLVEVYDEFAPQGVQFVGVNTRDESAAALAFAEKFGIEYPSVLDYEGGRQVQSAFAGQVPLNAVPTTLVLDSEGRVAHRVLGQLAGASQLRTLVKETLAEG